MQAFDRLQAPQATYGYPEMPLSGPYGSMYPQDELSRIKMRNRRFMSSCAQEMNPGMQQGMSGNNSNGHSKTKVSVWYYITLLFYQIEP